MSVCPDNHFGASECPRANVRYAKGTVDLGINKDCAYLNQEHALLAGNALTLHTSAHSALEPAPERRVCRRLLHEQDVQ